MWRIVAMLALVAGIGLASAKEPPPSRPAYAGAYEPQGADERGLWMQLDEYERAFRDNPGFVSDTALRQWVRSVLCRTVGEDRCGATRIYIVQDSSFNASMAPNGLMIIHTGLLARLHSEAELALVLAHEFAHFELRHSLEMFRKQRSATDAMAWIALGSIATGVSAAQSNSMIVSSVFAFNRAQETAADELGSKYILASPYALRASAVWQRATDEANALRAERGLRKLRKTSPGLTDTHPTNNQRFKYFSAIEAVDSRGAPDGAEEYRVATSALLPEIFAALVKRNDFAGTDYVIRGRGEALGWDASLLFARAELYRMRGGPRDLTTAQSLFQQATTMPDAPAEAWRGIGLCALRLGNNDMARPALREYLRRAPHAKDYATIKMLGGGDE